MPVEGYMWLGSILNNITQKYEDRRGCTEVGLGAASLRQQQSWEKEGDRGDGCVEEAGVCLCSRRYSREQQESEEGKIAKSAAGVWGLRLLRREEIEDSEDDICQVTSFDVCPVVWMKLQDLSGP